MKLGRFTSDLLHAHAEARVEVALLAVAVDLPVASLVHRAHDAHACDAPDVGAHAFVKEAHLARRSFHDVELVGGDAVSSVLEDGLGGELGVGVADDVVAAPLDEVRGRLAPSLQDVLGSLVKLDAEVLVGCLAVVPALALGHLLGPGFVSDDDDVAVDAAVLQLAQDALEAVRSHLSHFLPFMDREHDTDRETHFLARFCAFPSMRLGTM